MKTKFAAFLLVPLALSLAACGDSETPAAGSGSGSGDGVTVGIKFDQPGLGLKSGNSYSGLDVDVANYVAKDLGLGTVTFREARRLVEEQGAEAIMLGGTDLFLAFQGQRHDFRLVDCADIHVDAIFQKSSIQNSGGKP